MNDLSTADIRRGIEAADIDVACAQNDEKLAVLKTAQQRALAALGSTHGLEKAEAALAAATARREEAVRKRADIDAIVAVTEFRELAALEEPLRVQLAKDQAELSASAAQADSLRAALHECTQRVAAADFAVRSGTVKVAEITQRIARHVAEHGDAVAAASEVSE